MARLAPRASSDSIQASRSAGRGRRSSARAQCLAASNSRSTGSDFGSRVRYPATWPTLRIARPSAPMPPSGVFGVRAMAVPSRPNSATTVRIEPGGARRLDEPTGQILTMAFPATRLAKRAAGSGVECSRRLFTIKPMPAPMKARWSAAHKGRFLPTFFGSRPSKACVTRSFATNSRPLNRALMSSVEIMSPR